MTIVVQRREARGMTDRAMLIYQCGVCPETGIHGEITAHLHEKHGTLWTEIARLLGRARYQYRRQPVEVA